MLVYAGTYFKFLRDMCNEMTVAI